MLHKGTHFKTKKKIKKKSCCCLAVAALVNHSLAFAMSFSAIERNQSQTIRPFPFSFLQLATLWMSFVLFSLPILGHFCPFFHLSFFFSDHIILFSLCQQLSCLFLAFMISNSFSPLITRLLVLLFLVPRLSRSLSTLPWPFAYRTPTLLINGHHFCDNRTLIEEDDGDDGILCYILGCYFYY